ncbi:MAG TPA: molybdopterin-dependent oxidoreductase [Geminicoccus sp.]|uniref:molybdopterin-dependent oxidoreductase n=1 Tax=Geminicoccus sp. TaxID=2024832 RepID=UPI002E2FB52A|nr:molybdopterin-dependent oxidoreductase [Geminicoccus sp.]HEX2529661.1 molybdopterin-dependent oxidoreductase [Geminicoccus sp.]
MSNSGRYIHAAHWGAFYAVVEDGRFVRAEPFDGDPTPSPIITSMPEAIQGPARVRHPMVRKAWLERRDREERGTGPFVQVSWDEALDLVAGELQRVRAEHGPASVYSGSYGWSSAGRFHHAKSQLQRFMNLTGGSTVSIQNYSYAAAITILPHVIGTLAPVGGPVSSWDGIAEHTQLMICFGGLPLKNAQVEPGGIGHHTTETWIRRCKDAGTSFVNLGPNRADLPPWLDAHWIPVRPNTDTALILALCHVLLAEKLHDQVFLDRYCAGFDRFSAYLEGRTDGTPKTPEWAEPITGVPADRIRDLARRMAGCRTMINLAWGLQRADHGEQPYWAAIALASMLGQIGLPGGGFAFGYSAMGGNGSKWPKLANPTHSQGLNPIDSWIPLARIADMLLHPGGTYSYDGDTRTYPDVRLVYWCGGNPFHHHQDLNRLVRAFRRPDTVVVNEIFWTATARHADIVLPASSTLERNDLGTSRQDDFLIAMKKAIGPVGEARSDFEIFEGLAERAGIARAFTEGRSEMEWLRHLYERAYKPGSNAFPDFDTFWAQGWLRKPVPDEPHTLFAEFRADPAGHRLRTPSGRIELYSEKIAGFGYADCPGHPTWIPPAEWAGSAKAAEFPIHLLSPQPASRLHSQLDGAGVSRMSKIQGREPVRLARADAEARGLGDGDMVRIWNDRGALLAGVIVSDDLIPGVAQLATGAWYDPDAPFGLERRGNPNVLSLDKGASSLSQAPSAQSCLVQIERWTAELPAIGADVPPTDPVAPLR